MNVLNARSPSKIFTSGQVFFIVFVSNETIFSRSHWNYCVSGKSDTFFSAHLAFLLKPDGEFPHSRDGGSRVDEQRVGMLKGAGHPVHSEQARGGQKSGRSQTVSIATSYGPGSNTGALHQFHCTSERSLIATGSADESEVCRSDGAAEIRQKRMSDSKTRSL